MIDNFQSLISDFDYVIKRLDTLRVKETAVQNAIDISTREAEALQKRQDLIIRARERYKKAVDIRYTKSIKELEDLLNDVVDVIFYDKHYTINIDLSNKYNKSMSFWCYDADKDLMTPLSKPGTGRGVKTVVSTIIYAYYLLKFKAPYMFLDEGLINIDASYEHAFFDFIKELCKKDKLCLVLISHDERFFNYADEVYTVNDGVVLHEDSTIKM